MSRAAFAVSVAVLAALAARARADDWLAALDVRELSPAQLALHYPSRELPALVAAGDALLLRLQLPAALTPPPGVQQERALSGFRAELVGTGLPLAPQVNAQHRHHLTVLALRPDEASTLVYRVRFAVPAYMPPGTYQLLLHTPYGEQRCTSCVRVVRADTPARLAGCRPPSASGQELASLPIDVWMCPNSQAEPEPEPGTLLPPPTLQLPATSLALRVGKDLWLQRKVGETANFDRELRAVAWTERRLLTALTGALLGRLTPLPPELGELRVEREPTSLTLDARDAKLDRSVPLLLPATARWDAPSGALSLFAGSDLALHEVRSVFGLLHVKAGASVRLQIGPPAPAAPRFALKTIRAHSGKLTRVYVEHAPPDARVAFDYGVGKSALSGPELLASFGGPLETPVRALVLPREGGAQLLRARAWVEPSRPPNCAVVNPHGRGGMAAGALLFALAILLKRRSLRGPGNRLGSASRSEHRHGANSP